MKSNAAPPQGYEDFVAECLHDAMLARDLPRVIEVGKVAQALVAIEVERARRGPTKGDGR